MLIISFLPILIIVIGGYFLMKLRFFFILHPIKTAGKIKRSMKSKEARHSLSLALAGTLGVGNIVGVAYGISVGGAGSLFWIFVSSFFAAVIKYAESTLAADNISFGYGGMNYVMEKSFCSFGRILGILYSLFCLFLSFTMGTSLQVNSVTSTLSAEKKSCAQVVLLIFFILVFFVIVGGAKKIERVTAKLIPLSTIIYIILCLGVIFSNFEKLPEVLVRIVKEAFGFRSGIGGVSAFLAINSMREGFARGLLSNEAGAGTSAMAETRSGKSPCETGLFGICEVFFDTVLLCSLTGLAILTSSVGIGQKRGIEIVSSAFFSVFGKFGTYTLFLLIFSFAFSTVICWYYYGISSSQYLFGKRGRCAYTFLFLFSILLADRFSAALIIFSSDVLLFFMTLFTSLTLIKKSERILRLSEKLLKNSDV